MMSSLPKRFGLAIVTLTVVGVLLRTVLNVLHSGTDARVGREAAGPVPVETAAVERGALELRRVFSGTMESAGELVVAPKVAGRLVQLAVDLGDPVRRGQIVAELDNDEYRQAVSQKEAELAVAKANAADAVSALEIAERELHRVETLREQGVASESRFDAAQADTLAKQAAVEVAKAQVTRAEAELETAKIRLGYTSVTATWRGDDAVRYVAERFVDEGDTVSANTPLFSIVQLDPILAVIYVTEKDYSRLGIGQAVHLTTDAYPREAFTGSVSRIAPVFRQTSRQARVELTVANADQRLKPGMFVRVGVVLDRVEDAVIVPVEALTRRNGRDVLFVVDPGGDRVSMRPVTLGIIEADRVQVLGEGIEGRIVVLGQQLIDDGSAITVPEDDAPDPRASIDTGA